jgi:predicted ester cyclase
MNPWNTQQLIEALVHQPSVIFQEDVVVIDHAQAQVFRGRAAAQSLFFAFFITGFPGAQAGIHTVVEDSHYTVVELTFSGCQRGPFMGIAPTGQPVAVPMALVCRMMMGKVVRVSLYYDAGTLLRQLGLAS